MIFDILLSTRLEVMNIQWRGRRQGTVPSLSAAVLKLYSLKDEAPRVMYSGRFFTIQSMIALISVRTRQVAY